MEELIIKERETKIRIAEVINNSNLPAFILRPMFEEYLRQIQALEEKQYSEAENLIKEKKKGDKQCKK